MKLAGCLDAGLLGYTIYITGLKLVFGGDLLMMRQLPDGSYVDDETGEPIQKHEVFLRPGEDYKVYKARNNSDESYVPWGKDRPFIKMFIEYMPELGLRLSGGSLAIAFRLSEYISYGSNLVAKRGGNAISNVDIQEMMGYSEKTVIKLMQELVDEMIFFRGRTGRSYQYFANPYLFAKGTVINSTLAAMFREYPRIVERRKNIEGVKLEKQAAKH